MEGMLQYIGVKLVQAKPMNKGEFNARNDLKGRQGENDSDKGYLVKYDTGYLSWCPKEQFGIANRRCDAMPFGHAIEAMKMGMKVARAGWNKQHVIIKSEPDADYIKLVCADGSEEYGMPSNADMLADDWMIVG